MPHICLQCLKAPSREASTPGQASSSPAAHSASDRLALAAPPPSPPPVLPLPISPGPLAPFPSPQTRQARSFLLFFLCAFSFPSVIGPFLSIRSLHKRYFLRPLVPETAVS